MIRNSTGLTVKKTYEDEVCTRNPKLINKNTEFRGHAQRSTYVLILAVKMSSLSKFYVSSTECCILIG